MCAPQFHFVIRPAHTMEDRNRLLASQLLLNDDEMQNEAAAGGMIEEDTFLHA